VTRYGAEYSYCSEINKSGECEKFEALPPVSDADVSAARERAYREYAVPESRISRLIRWIAGADR
jgi:hypothetical protein